MLINRYIDIRKIEYLILIGLALIVSATPVISLTFSWITTFLHEISHGLIAVITGGKIVKIELMLRGAGKCTTQGGVEIAILLAGYLGAVLWGSVIYTIASNQINTRIMLYFLIVFILLAGYLWVRNDALTWTIIAILITKLFIILRVRNTVFKYYGLRFIGVYVMLDGVASPFDLLDGLHYGDGSRLADITGIPEIAWVVFWFVFGLGIILMHWKKRIDICRQEDIE